MVQHRSPSINQHSIMFTLLLFIYMCFNVFIYLYTYYFLNCLRVS